MHMVVHTEVMVPVVPEDMVILINGITHTTAAAEAAAVVVATAAVAPVLDPVEPAAEAAAVPAVAVQNEMIPIRKAAAAAAVKTAAVTEAERKPQQKIHEADTEKVEEVSEVQVAEAGYM